MARLLIAVLAAATTHAFKTPKSRALKVRGGVDIQKVGTALIGLEGLVGMIAPETACKNYGHSPSPDDVQFKRYTSTWLAAVALLFSSDASSAASTSLFLSAAVTTVCMPVVEALGVDKPSVSAWIVVCIVLGKLSKMGHLSKWVAPTLAIALGLADTFFTEAHYKLYGLDAMSPFSRMFAQLLGSCLLSGGTYVAVLAKGDSQEKAFGYAYAAIAAAALKAGLVNAEEVGMGKAPFFVWGAIASYIAYKALDE